MVIKAKKVLKQGAGATGRSKQEVIYVAPRACACAVAATEPAPVPSPTLEPTPVPPHAVTKSSRELATAQLVGYADAAYDVIDLGAPRATRRERERAALRCQAYVPNPRLYPGKPQPKPPRANAGAGRPRRHKRLLRRPVPNSRLYRPAPPRTPPPAPARPHAAWPAPPPLPLDTASHAALRLGAARAGRSPPPPPAPLSRRLVVTLPAAAAGGDSPPRLAMDTAGRHSTSPEVGSDGNDTLSAPSEFLAEFLSAIMRRQYAEALKYCRLILQYEPQNATARGFYPLLQHKLLHHKPMGGDRACSSDEASDRSGAVCGEPARADSLMEQGADSDGSEEGDEEGSGAGGSVASQSSLELDSEPSLELSRRTDSGSGYWESSGSASRSDADDNGNAPPCATPPRATRALSTTRALVDGDENDNATGAGAGGPHATHHTKSESVAALRQLRAQFACSIK